MKHALQTKITGRGQTAIPVAIMAALEAAPGRSLQWTIGEHGTCVVSVVPETVASAASMLGFAKTFRKTVATEEWMRKLGGNL